MKIPQIIYLAFFLSFSTARLHSQTTPIIHEGQIEFERRVNAYALLNAYYTDQIEQSFVQQYKSSKPQFGISNYTLLFNDTSSVYSPNHNLPNLPEVSLLMTQNIVYSDLNTRTSISRKKAVDDEFLVIDSMRKVKWKITDETKQIAGFTCRRANAIIMDSVYVVAFYTDQIVPRSGPESFSGLPGMILGVALPYEHMSWFATHVISKTISNKQLQPPGNGKKVKNDEFLKLLKDNPLLQVAMRLKLLLIRNFML